MIDLEKMEVGVSVVIVTYNGKNRLTETLKHLSLQCNVDFQWEVLLIDNNSTDGTAHYAKDYWNLLGKPCELRTYLESQPGTLNARNAGFEQAKFKYVLFCDDDNSLSSNYLKIAFNYIVQDENIAALGGKGIPKFEIDSKVPEWIMPHIRFLGCGPQGNNTGDTTYAKGCLYTAGTIIDRVWINKLKEVGFVPKLSGRIGNSLIAGEDTELMYAFKAIGGKLHFCEDMEFHHVIPAKRLTLDYFKRLYRAMGYSDFILEYFFVPQKSLIKSIVLSFIVLLKYVFLSLVRKNESSKQTLLNFQRQLGRWQANINIIKGAIQSILHNLF